MKYSDNPAALLLVPLFLLVGGGVAAAAVIMKKKKEGFQHPVLPNASEYPYGQQPTNQPTTHAPYGANPTEIVKNAQEQYKKYGPGIKDAAQTAYDIFKSGETPPQKPAEKSLDEMNTSEMSVYFEQRAKTTGKEPTDEEMKIYFRQMEEEEAKKAEASGEAKPGDLDKAKKAAGPLSLVTGAAKGAWAGVSAAAKGVAAGVSAAAPVLVPLAIVAAVGVTVNSYRMAMKKYDKYDDLYDAYRANAITYAEATKKIKKAITTMRIGKQDLLRKIENMKIIVNAVAGE
ncbi:MAG: hypothetical protein GF375_02375 [Candidatus Omnitrophica bacterium]|nr:hypothetical protein [Candidatus Omnitrophota bacterium]